MLAAWASCTVTKENYRTLSFFFDGVPDPGAPSAAVDPVTGAVATRAILSVHEPYAQEKCDECHGSRLRLSRNDGGSCLKCHAEVPGRHERMHGPVVASACLWCHQPHESPFPHLMRDTDRRVCGQCHTPDLLDASRVPEHGNESRGCLECHVGHGASAAFLLRPGGSRPGERGK